ncbi:hypothetical protein LguiB_002636 [Lonicera macranthoides]
MQALVYGPFYVAYDTKESNKVDRARCRHELTHNVDNIADIRPGDGEIVETTHKLSV